jgi:hypothetical protein
MSNTIKPGSVLFREQTMLPQRLPCESESYRPHWRLVTGCDANALGRAIAKEGWTLFCLVGDIKSIAFAFSRGRGIGKAVSRILAKLNHARFNSVEITEVIPKRFLGIPYVSISARSRHIQESTYLFHSTDFRAKIEPVDAFV